jgi:hypothetical protein
MDRASIGAPVTDAAASSRTMVKRQDITRVGFDQRIEECNGTRRGVKIPSIELYGNRMN